MASETSNLTSMQLAFIKAGQITEERAVMLNRIAHSQQVKENKRLAEKAKKLAKIKSLDKPKKTNQNRKDPVQKKRFANQMQKSA